MNGRCDGFTLAEVLVALFLITVSLLAAAPMFIYAARMNSSGADTGSASALASERLEILRAMPFAALVDGGSLTTDVTGYFDDSHEGFGVRWSITGGLGPGRCKRIEVRAATVAVAEVVPVRQVTLRTMRAP